MQLWHRIKRYQLLTHHFCIFVNLLADKKPTEKELRRHVASKASDVWKKVCTELGIPFRVQKTICDNNPGDPEGAFFECLVHWLNGNVEDSPVMWKTVLIALKQSDKVELAKDIEDTLKAE